MYQYQCPRCGSQFMLPNAMNSVRCPSCGEQFQAVMPEATPPQFGTPNYAYGAPAAPGVFDQGPSGKSRGVAGLLAILLGSLGIHYFYVGKTGGGFLCILLSLITCGLWSIIPLIQGILMLTMTQEQFESKYVNTPSTFPLF